MSISQNPAASSFAALCARICRQSAVGAANTDAPLSGRIKLRSMVTPAFHADDFWVDPASPDGQPTVWLAFLTLAGATGPLPWWLTERLLWRRDREGQALHAFLDALNRRFWELLFMAHCAGNHPQFGYVDARYATLLADLPAAVSGVERDLPLAGVPAGLRHRIEQLCWDAGHGIGGAAALAALLTQLCGRPVSLRQHMPVRLGLTQRNALCLGRAGRQQHAGVPGVIGVKAQVACGLLLQVVLRENEELGDYLPGSQKRLPVLCRALNLFYGQVLPPVSMQLRVPGSALCATLGKPQVCLGWGAMLATKLPMSLVVTLSVRTAQSECAQLEEMA